MAKDFAIIQTGGKQYKVSSGQKLKVETIMAVGGSVTFDKVLLRAAGGEVQIGAPYLPKAAVEAKLVREGRTKKQIVFKYHAKTRQHKKKGHRQNFSEVQITSV
jgi:large subunit ribosomal protein L21